MKPTRRDFFVLFLGAMGARAGLLGASFTMGAPGPGTAAVVGLATSVKNPEAVFLTIGSPGLMSPARPRTFHVASSPPTRPAGG